MEDAIEFGIGGIKCDNTECDYEDMTVKFDQFDEYLNKPCPCCGANLLTQEDLDTSLAMKQQFEMLNDMMAGISEEKMQELIDSVTPEVIQATESVLGLPEGTLDDIKPHDKITLDLDMDGSGKVKVGSATVEKTTIH